MNVQTSDNVNYQGGAATGINPQYAPQHGICPGCGRCKECGRPYETQPYNPYGLPQPTWGPYWGTITSGSSSMTMASGGLRSWN